MCSSLLVKEGILRVHPDLAGRHAEAGQLTSESTGGFISECIFTSVKFSIIRLTNDSKFSLILNPFFGSNSVFIV